VRPPTRIGLLLALAVALVAVPTVATGGTSAPAAPAVNSQTYTDSTGENPAAPDISTIVVSNDDAGMLNFRINIPNRPTLGQDMYMVMFFDTDNNPATGSLEDGGAEYVMELFRGEIALFRWDGANFTRRFGDPSAVTLSFAYQGGITIRISANELGATKAFRFFVIVLSGIVIDPVSGEPDFTNAVGDAAPGGGVGLYPYTVIVAPPTLVVRNVKNTPARPIAGREFTMRMRATRSDTGAVVQNGRVTCVGRAGNARLRAVTARVVAGAATCTWRIPPLAKGKRFTGSITLVFEGLRATRGYSSRIR
jgi:hypothetical protein